ncbi:leucine-rich repeat-containing protein 43 isoform X2 [Hyla sarda]|uniref:leucine-rich repeat-containing protein 43 isoform X2 n=1 Tax=Hyla sarda TaxID=327740 RepID=UPI0024C2AEE4|nr:leucine-rich repeat-containing protein 43 isoform X2 [Hyla sarda]
MGPVTVTEALRQQLKALCLNSFPCGSGSWNKSHLEAGKRTPVDTYWEEDDPNEENQDTLHDLLNQPNSPWEPDDTCNSEVQHLRELAVKYPERLTDQIICSHFKRLRIVDKEVTEVDRQLLKFQNLEELVLSANKLKTVHSGNLPRKLKILELCSNHISNFKDLSINPPPLLQHLGLAYNRIQCSLESLFPTTDIWPNLVFLDLSYNDLTDLFNLVSRISTLQSLRVLTLQGNPLTLITTYRGYTIDCLPNLCVLDDSLILPDERYKFSGLSKKKEALENKAKFYVHIGKVQGISNPNAHTEQNSGDYPLTTVTYHVCYEFIEDQPSSDSEEYQPHTYNQLQQVTAEGNVEQLHPLNLHTGLYKTAGSLWNDSIEYEYVMEHTSSDLLALKSFLLSGMKVTVTEEKILSWPKDPEENSVVSKPDKQVGGTEKEKDKARNSARSPEKSNKTKERKLKSGREQAPKTARSTSGKEKQKDTEMKPTEEDPAPPIVALTVEVEVQLVC